MSLQDVAIAMARAEAVLRRRPEHGLHDDAPAVASWQGGVATAARHANGTQVGTDMPAELGGSGTQVSPGWLFRAGIAACATTSIAMLAAVEGVELTALEARVDSRSDSRGMLGMAGADGTPVYAGPGDLRLHVRIAAEGSGASAEQLRALVEAGLRRSPIPNAVSHATALALQVDVE